MLPKLKELRDKTVFAPMEEDLPSDKILAILYHRSAVTIYFIYAVWGAVTIFSIIPSLFLQQGSLFQQFYSGAMIIASLGAMSGALTFPRTGTRELYFGVSVSALILFYIVSIGASAIGGDVTKWGSFVYGLSHVVLPISRSIFIYLTLIRTAKRERDATGD